MGGSEAEVGEMGGKRVRMEGNWGEKGRNTWKKGGKEGKIVSRNGIG